MKLETPRFRPVPVEEMLRCRAIMTACIAGDRSEWPSLRVVADENGFEIGLCAWVFSELLVLGPKEEYA